MAPCQWEALLSLNVIQWFSLGTQNDIKSKQNDKAHQSSLQFNVCCQIPLDQSQPSKSWKERKCFLIFVLLTKISEGKNKMEGKDKCFYLKEKWVENRNCSTLSYHALTKENTWKPVSELWFQYHFKNERKCTVVAKHCSWGEWTGRQRAQS